MTIQEFLALGREELWTHGDVSSPGAILATEDVDLILSHLDEMAGFQKEYVLYAYDLGGGKTPLPILHVLIRGSHRCARLMSLQRLEAYESCPRPIMEDVASVLRNASDSIERGVAESVMARFGEPTA